jgi:hypothetical protein
MRLPTWMVAVALGASTACASGEEDQPMESITPPLDSTSQQLVQEPDPPPVQPAEQPPMPEVTRQVAAMPQADEPWMPEFTGTVSPGMSWDAVVEQWGEPVLERTAGDLTFMYFRNGCEVTCGTYDVVFLENGQVVDAIVRFAGHTYTGVSSSPADRAAEFTPPVPAEENTENS